MGIPLAVSAAVIYMAKLHAIEMLLLASGPVISRFADNMLQSLGKCHWLLVFV